MGRVVEMFVLIKHQANPLRMVFARSSTKIIIVYINQFMAYYLRAVVA